MPELSDHGRVWETVLWLMPSSAWMSLFFQPLRCKDDLGVEGVQLLEWDVVGARHAELICRKFNFLGSQGREGQ